MIKELEQLLDEAEVLANVLSGNYEEDIEFYVNVTFTYQGEMIWTGHTVGISEIKEVFESNINENLNEVSQLKKKLLDDFRPLAKKEEFIRKCLLTNIIKKEEI